MAITGGLVVRNGREPASSLLIGIGNPLRGDDGVGPWLVETWTRRRAWREAARRGEFAAAAAAAADPLVDAVEAAESDLPGLLRLRVVDQLLPELAEELAAVRRVLFVDAWRVASGTGLQNAGSSGGEFCGSGLQESETPWRGPRLLPIAAADRRAPGGMGWGTAGWTPGHHLSPSVLLQLTAGLYGRAPAAQSLLIPAMAFAASDPGDGLARFSADLRNELPRAWQLLDRWLQQGAERLEQPSGW